MGALVSDITSPKNVQQANLWVRFYCVVQGPVLYVFANEHKLNLRGVVNMGATGLESAHAGWALGTNYGNSRAKKAVITQVTGAPYFCLTKSRLLVDLISFPLFLIQHQRVATDIFSIIKANLDQTTAKLNSMLLMGDDEERRILEYSLKNENKRVGGSRAHLQLNSYEYLHLTLNDLHSQEVLGIIAFQLARHLGTQAPVTEAALPTIPPDRVVPTSNVSSTPPLARGFSSGTGMNARTMSGAQWLSAIVESG